MSECRWRRIRGGCLCLLLMSKPPLCLPIRSKKRVLGNRHSVCWKLSTHLQPGGRFLILENTTTTTNRSWISLTCPNDLLDRVIRGECFAGTTVLYIQTLHTTMHVLLLITSMLCTARSGADFQRKAPIPGGPILGPTVLVQHPYCNTGVRAARLCCGLLPAQSFVNDLTISQRPLAG